MGERFFDDRFQRFAASDLPPAICRQRFAASDLPPAICRQRVAAE